MSQSANSKWNGVYKLRGAAAIGAVLVGFGILLIVEVLTSFVAGINSLTMIFFMSHAVMVEKINPTRITASVLGIYAGIVGIEHGIFEVLQGNIRPDGLLISAIGPPCQPEATWTACLPALTLIPNFLVTGIVAMLVGLGMVIWAARFVPRHQGGQIFILLAISLMLVGGGFVPMFIGIFAGLAGTRIDAPPKWKWLPPLKVLWPWALILLVLWAPSSWIIGDYFPQTMLDYGFLLFLGFDIGLPVLSVLAGFGYGQERKG